MLWLNSVQALSDNAAAAIALHVKGNLQKGYIELSLKGLRNVPVSVAERLAVHGGSLALNMDQLSEQALAAIIAHPGLDLDFIADTTKNKIAALKHTLGTRKRQKREHWTARVPKGLRT